MFSQLSCKIGNHLLQTEPKQFVFHQ